MTPTSTPERSRIPSRRRRAEASGSSGSRISVSGPFAFDWSTPAEAQTNPCRVSAMISGGLDTDDATALLEDHLDSSRVLCAGELSCSSGRLDIVEMEDAALDLRDRLLRDDDDVAACEPSRALRRFDDQRTEVVPLVELRDPAQRDDAELAGQGRPVTRMPAWPR